MAENRETTQRWQCREKIATIDELVVALATRQETVCRGTFNSDRKTARKRACILIQCPLSSIERTLSLTKHLRQTFKVTTRTRRQSTMITRTICEAMRSAIPTDAEFQISLTWDARLKSRNSRVVSHSSMPTNSMVNLVTWPRKEPKLAPRSVTLPINRLRRRGASCHNH